MGVGWGGWGVGWVGGGTLCCAPLLHRLRGGRRQNGECVGLWPWRGWRVRAGTAVVVGLTAWLRARVSPPQNHYREGVRVANWVEEEYGDHLAGREGGLVSGQQAHTLPSRAAHRAALGRALCLHWAAGVGAPLGRDVWRRALAPML